ncbi:MAG: hypothetical protein JO250_16605 [Armatimonadetes bacterium]|nr:hypothetical protein [Armatimonadota bacterium]
MVTARPASHSTPKPHAWQGAVGVPLLLLALTLIYFWPQIGQGRALYWGDIGLYFTPMTRFLHDNLCAGRLPLWNPLILCGAPFVGNPQTWPLYPLTALLPIVSAPYFLSLTVAVHVWLAGMGTALFLRRTLGLGVAASLLGAITFMFGGWLVSKEQFPNMVQAAAYLPWVLWGLERLLAPPAPDPGGAGEGIALGGGTARGAPTQGALLFGLILGLQLLAAHAQITLLTLYLAVAWGIFVLARRRVPFLRLAGRLALAGLVAVGLSAAQVLPTLQLFHDGWRQNMSFRIVDRFYLPLNQSANWVLPTLHGHPYFGNFSARGNFWETCCYVGWLPFALALRGAVAACRRGGDARVRFWAVAFLVAYLLALGGGASHRPGPYWLAYKLLPGFHSFHDPARCLFWATFALSVLAAAGLETLPARVRRPGPAIALVLLLAFADLAWFGRTIYPLADPATLFPMTRTVAALRGDPAFAARQARFLAPDSPRVWHQFSPWRAYRQGVPDFQALWTDTLTPNLMMPYGLPDAYGYEPVTRHDAQQVMAAINSAFRPDAPADQRARAAAWAGALGVRAVATDRVRAPEATLPGLTPRLSDPSLPPLRGHEPGRVFLSRNARWQPRARLMTDFVAVGGQKAGLARVMDALQHPGKRALDLARTVVVAGPIPFDPTPAPPSGATITEDTPDRVAVAADSPRPALLVLADTLHPGWRATVDGRPAPVLSADGCLRAVALPQPGAHRVVFLYRPTLFLLGLYVTLLTLSASLGAAIYDGIWKNREETRRAPPKHC